MMEWFQQNRWLGRFLIATGAATLVALILLFLAKGSYRRASERFDEAAAERNRLERLDPFPNEENYRKMTSYVESYKTNLDNFKADLKTRVLPLPADLAPNEFQSRLRQAMTATTEKAAANKVRLPDTFFLGFDQFTAALPPTAAAPLLGQELAEIQSLMNILIDARVDAVTALTRTPLSQEGAAAATPTPPPGKKPAGPGNTVLSKVVESGVINVTFMASPAAARKAIDQIVSANDQLYVIRSLHVRNEKDKGPPKDQTAPSAPDPVPAVPRDSGAGAANAAPPAPGAKPNLGNLTFIVGNEHIEVSARIELVRLTY